VDTLRRILYLQAAVWAIAGLAVAVVPRFVLVTLFGQPPLPDQAWPRLVGVQAIGLAMVMVMVAHRVEEMWWWSWAFAIVAVAITAVVVLNAAFGLPPGESSLFWWVFAAVALMFSLGLLYGLFVSSREQPVP
jgi:hypothetical protein